ncbi:UDP-glucose 4-epimerase GalE [Paenibacillus sedimenti]|uniref:UDP-glucose 4-epimerase n=1 Tax=Paenibacillus sedimenti TaxID=2770274 RepID=A0A926KRS5_9BACL|nr:UDP-glucose 4-epimerase GalE [Paenibacillus sedimenti]MBD0382907.1 UDP-glucose 4-epimerase GalE [Paenibacillus sedimenti]
MAVLVCGGTGYIGSHVVAALIEQHEEVVIIDRMATGREKAVLGGKLYLGDLNDPKILDTVFKENEIEAVIHLAASSLVGESMTQPLAYYRNNVEGTLRLLEAMHKHRVDKIVFSSTAAVYGDPERIPIREADRKMPRNTYGETKLAVERMLHWAEQAHGIKYVILRYFNVAGAHDNGLIGEDHDPETHLIPLAIQAALEQRESMIIYGADYSTKDGTCVRDYIHVMDVAEAHLLAVNSLRNGGKSAVYNLGNSEGYTVKEVIEAVKKVTGREFPIQIAPRRQGDPAVLIASPDLIMEELNWYPKRGSLEKMVESAWEWHRTHPYGYAESKQGPWRGELLS